MTNLFIPKKIRVGFQNRKDTYTGKLGYVIYYDEKGKIRKETSWKGWCDSKIPALELENIPQNNYVFNKGIQRYGEWGSGRSVIRVYDPRDFEFEISIDNLIGILMHSDISKRDIAEKCVFAWAGSELVLLPTNSQEYQDSVKYTEKQDTKVSSKDLVKGHVYTQKKNDSKLTYIGYYQFYEVIKWGQEPQSNKGKRHIFHDGKNFVIPSVLTLSSCILNEPVENYANLVDEYFKSAHAYKHVGFRINQEKQPGKTYYHMFKKISDDTYAYINYYPQQGMVNITDIASRIKYYTLFKTENDEVRFNSDGCAKFCTSNNQRLRNTWGWSGSKLGRNDSIIVRYDEELELIKSLNENSQVKQIYNGKHINLFEFENILLQLGYGIGYFYNEKDYEYEYKG